MLSKSLLCLGNLIPKLPFSVGCMLLVLGMYFVIGNEGPESWLLTGDRFGSLPLKFS